jgi:hypothetical protein
LAPTATMGIEALQKHLAAAALAPCTLGRQLRSFGAA